MRTNVLVPCEPNCEHDYEDMRQNLISLAINGLMEMRDVKDQLFCYRIRKRGREIMREGLSLRYTMMSLLGLHQYELQGNTSPISTKAIMHGLMERSNEIDNIGDLGLYLWLRAMATPGLLDTDYSDLFSKNPLRRYQDARQGRTMELAWFLTGLSCMALALKDGLRALKPLAHRTYNLLLENYRGKGIYGHVSTNSPAGLIRGRVGSFADQVYPIYALSKFALAFGEKDALRIALECARTICRLQGSLGQWWWHYDSLTGKVIGQYPVYAVHQDSMAPMALFAISEATGEDFLQPICKGLKWIFGSNELGKDLTEPAHHVIWRSLYVNKFTMYYKEASALLGLPKNNGKYDGLFIKLECRPYHLGWILYALSKNMSRS